MAREFTAPAIADDTVVLCRMNAARVRVNRTIRECVGLAGSLLVPEDRVVCLRNTNVQGRRIANGCRGVVESAEVDDVLWYRCALRIDEDNVRVKDARVPRSQLGQEKTIDAYSDLGGDVRSWADAGMLCDYGYALTAHKAQGSQWRRVVVCVPKKPERTWLYTAVTRAVEELVLVEE